jgi:UDP-glucose 4-epimerase
LQYLADGGASVALNLGTGAGHSVRQIVEAVEAETGRPIRTRCVARRIGDPPELVANPLRAQRLLGWHTSFSSLGEIVRTAVQWHRKWRASAPPAESHATDTGIRTDH